MEHQTKVLVVDDNPIVSEMMKRHLAGEFDVEHAIDYEASQKKAVEWQPDIIVLDVELPDRNGYEICDEFKQKTKTRDIPIIFHSANDSLRERMLGYEVGAVDYLYKGCEPEEIRAKLHAIARHAKHAQNLKDSVENAEKTAMEALSTSSELGKAVRYVEQSYTAADFDGLAGLLAEFCRDLDLSSVIMFVCRSGHRFYSSSGNTVAPIEQELMQKLHGTERFIDFGCRTLTNYPQVSILVKNMPIDDRERYGRIKDTIPFVLGATDAKVRMLDAEQTLTAHCASLTSSVEAAQLTLTTVKENFHRNLEIVSTVMSELISSITLDIANMNMDEKDEEKILTLVEGTSSKLHIILQENSETDTILEDLVGLLENLTTEQNKIIVDTLSSKSDAALDYEPDIELF